MRATDWLEKICKYDDEQGGKEIDISVSKLRDEASQTDYIYHCTSKDTLIKIIRTNTLWLTSLSSQKLNDPEEVNRIELPEYKDRVFVACFTKSRYPDADFWDEYGYKENGVIFRFRKEWLNGSFSVVDDKWSHIPIEKNDGEWFSREQDDQDALLACAMGYYAVKYDDSIIQQYIPLQQKGRFLHLEAIGLVKPKQGISKRTNKKRKWEKEKEIRYRTILESRFYSDKIEFRTIKVGLSADAFNTLEMGFSPMFPECEKELYIRQLKKEKEGINIRCYDEESDCC